MKVYLAHSLATTAEFNDSIRVANEIRELGYEVFVASENKNINDKSNNPTPKDIYNADIKELLSSHILVVNLNGNMQDGTITEIGAVAGYNEKLDHLGKTWDRSWLDDQIKIVAYTSNARLLQPQFFKGIPSASANHLTLGAITEWGDFVGTEKDMLNKLKG